jgi:hypothetical protein
VAALVATPAAAALADMHHEPATQPPRHGQLILILVLDPLLLDLPATLAPIRKRRVALLIDLPRRLTATMPAVRITRPPTRPARISGGLTARERRSLTLASTPRLLHLALQHLDPPPQPLVLRQQTRDLAPQALVLHHQRRNPRRQPRQLIHRLRWEHLNL